MPSIGNMSIPNEFQQESEHAVVTRCEIDYKSGFKSHDLYVLNERSYSNQFAPMYFNRLHVLRPRVSHSATKKWANESINGTKVVKRDKVLDVKPSEPSWVIGTVYMEMKYKPNILEEVSKNNVNVDVSGIESYVDQDLDEIYLEDESGRILLDGDIFKSTVLCTGVVVGVLGMETKPGCFTVVDIVYPLMSAQKPTRASQGKVAICSGLQFTGIWDAKHALLQDYLTGELGHDSSQLTRLIIAGNSVRVQEQDQVQQRNKYGAKNKSNFSQQSISQLDSFIHALLPSIPVDLMPGESDPAEISLPQQPLHRALFHKSQSYLKSNNFNTLTNPQWFQFNELRVLGTSGQNVNDVYKYVVPDSLQVSRLPIVEASLHWQNIVPTAPDTLACYPFEKDPFTMTETPHVYFIGNQPRFETKLLSLERGQVRIICVPDFNKSGQLVVLDTDTLDANVVTISS